MIIYDPKITGSFQINGGTISSIGEIDTISGSVAALNNASSSYLLNTSDTLTGDLTVTGTLTAQDLHVQEVTSSIIYSSGSNIFGSNASDTQIIYGNVGIGTTDPSDAKLTITGTDNPVGIGDEYGHTGIKFYGATAGQLEIFNNRGNDTYGNTIFTNGSSESMRITNGGYILTGARTSITGNWGAGSIEAERAVGAFNSNKTIYLYNNGTDIKLDAYDYGASSALDITIGGNGGDILLNGGNVGINNNNPLGKLHITTGDSGASSAWTNADELILESSGNAGLAFQTPNTGAATIAFQDPQSVQAGFIQYLHGDNLMRFATNGNNIRAVIDSGGDVGIGTDSPASTRFTNADNTVVDITGGLTNRGGVITLRTSDSSKEAFLANDGGILQIGMYTDNDIAFYTNNDQKLFIARDGKVTITGDSNSTAHLKFATVSGGSTNTYIGNFIGQMYLATNYYYDGGHNSDDASKRSMEVTLSDDSFNIHSHPAGSPGTRTRVLTVSGSQGYVGVNAESPNAMLQVSGVAPTYTNTATVFYGSTTNNHNHSAITLNSSGNALSGIIGSNLMYSNSTNYTQTNTSRSSGYIQFVNTTVTGEKSTIYLGGSTKGSNAGSASVTINGYGNVGIGSSSPQDKLVVDGTSSGAYVRINNAASGDISSGYMIYNGNNLDTQIYTNPTFGNTTFLSREDLAIRAGGGERARIKSNGNVGINENNPQGLLHVNGDSRFNNEMNAYAYSSTRANSDYFYQGRWFGNASYIHLKTDVSWGAASQMYSIHFLGHEYGASKPIDTLLCFYNYSSSSSVISIGYYGSHAATVYQSSDGYIVMRFDTSSGYYTGFTLSSRNTAQGSPIPRITATAQNSTATSFA